MKIKYTDDELKNAYWRHRLSGMCGWNVIAMLEEVSGDTAETIVKRLGFKPC